MDGNSGQDMNFWISKNGCQALEKMVRVIEHFSLMERARLETVFR